jgi:hypothetical protein
MKLLSPILLGLGLLSAAMASDDANHLRANTSARQLSSNNSGSGGGTWMWYLMLNALHAMEDHRGGPHSCGCNPHLPRCGLPHTHGTCISHSGSGSSSGGGDGDDGGDDCSGYPSCWCNGGCAVEESSSGNDNESNKENYDDNESTTNEEQYLEYNEYNEGYGYANQINGKKNLNVWPFLIAALVVGTVAAALMAKKVSYVKLLCVHYYLK